MVSLALYAVLLQIYLYSNMRGRQHGDAARNYTVGMVGWFLALVLMFTASGLEREGAFSASVWLSVTSIAITVAMITLLTLNLRRKRWSLSGDQ